MFSSQSLRNADVHNKLKNKVDSIIEKYVIQHIAYRVGGSSTWPQQFFSPKTKHIEKIPSSCFLKMQIGTQVNKLTILNTIV